MRTACGRTSLRTHGVAPVRLAPGRGLSLRARDTAVTAGVVTDDTFEEVVLKSPVPVLVRKRGALCAASYSSSTFAAS